MLITMAALLGCDPTETACMQAIRALQARAETAEGDRHDAIAERRAWMQTCLDTMRAVDVAMGEAPLDPHGPPPKGGKTSGKISMLHVQRMMLREHVIRYLNALQKAPDSDDTHQKRCALERLVRDPGYGIGMDYGHPMTAILADVASEVIRVMTCGPAPARDARGVQIQDLAHRVMCILDGPENAGSSTMP
jgi:hypothetical protein